MKFLSYFTDPLLRGPTLGSALMCVTAAVVGAIAVLRRRALLGETLSHAAYPGVLGGATLLGGLWVHPSTTWISLGMTLGALISCLLGYKSLQLLERLRIRADTALCFVLSSFFGIGLLLASRLQFTHAYLYQVAQTYLYGQTATLSDSDLWLFTTLATTVLVVFLLFYKEIQAICFDPEFAQVLGPRVSGAHWVFTALLLASVVIGLRTVGVVLMSAMLIIPAVTARQLCQRLPHMLLVAALVGGAAGIGGTILSLEGSAWTSQWMGKAVALPTGPIIVVLAAFLCALALLAAPQRGLVTRSWRICRFRVRCAEENLLKLIWRIGTAVSPSQLADQYGAPLWRIRWMCRRCTRAGWLLHSQGRYQLSHDGRRRAAQIIRLHRLWELYLVDYLGLGVERVHRSAEEIEHILTPEIEAELLAVLDSTALDPHQQPIPPKEVL